MASRSREEFSPGMDKKDTTDQLTDKFNLILTDLEENPSSPVTINAEVVKPSESPSPPTPEPSPSFDEPTSIKKPDFDWRMSLTSPSHDDKHRMENNQLRSQIKQLNAELQSEQETVSQLRRRLNAVEKDRLESTSRNNAEISHLESQIAKLRSQLEKGEANFQNLEFELTKTKREVNQHHKSALNKEANFQDTKEELLRKIDELSEEIRRLEDDAQQSIITLQNTTKQYNKRLEEKDHEISKYQSEVDILRADKEKLSSSVLQHQSAIADLNDRLQDITVEKKTQTENLRRSLTEIEYAKEREDRLKKDLETALHRLRTIEESIEAERASHLETKFNSEIVQLRVRDLEGALEVEKSANDEANKAIDRLTKQVRELEHAYEEERKSAKELMSKLDKIGKEHNSMKKQLTSEVENKKNVIGDLSKELEIHQKNFTELKDELTKAKKRQIYLEETYGGSMRELELLLENFQVDEKSKKTSKGKKESGKQQPNPTAVLESLRVTLMEYKKKLDTTTEELAKMKKLSDTLNREVDNCKEMIWAKDKSLEDAQKNYTRTAKELNRIRSQYAEMEGSFTRLKVDMQSSASNQTKDRKRVQELSEEIMKLVKRHKADDEEKLAYLHGMYQRLLAGRIMVPTKDQGLNQLTWADLTTIVYEQVSALVNASLRADEKMYLSAVKIVNKNLMYSKIGSSSENAQNNIMEKQIMKICHLEEALKMKEEALDDIQKSHEDQLNKLSSLTKERELSWQKQKEEIEGHYSQLLSELQARSKDDGEILILPSSLKNHHAPKLVGILKSQAMADQAWEKIRMTGTVQHGLETECSELRNQTSESQKQNNALLAACSLLFGAIYPMCSRSNHLAMQRRMLEEQLNNWDFCRERAELLVHTLGSELKSVKGEIETDVSKTARRHPLLVFRIGAVAVLAANRLKYFGRNSTNKVMFVTYDSVISHQNGVVVCTGGIKPTQKKQLDDTDSDEMDIESIQRKTQTSVINWLSNEELRSTVITATSELLDMAYRLKDKDKASSVETRALVNTVRSSFTNLLDKVSRQFEDVCSQPTLAVRERNSLVRLLGRGLHRICTKMPVEEKKYIATLQDLMGALQNHILDFTQRLHSVEVERRELLMELNQLREGRHDIPQKDDDGRSNSDMEPVKDKEPQYVAMEKFESVCYELNNALRREQQAQQLLMEQSRQLEELTLRLDLYTSEGMEKEQTLGEAIHSLAEMKLELKRKEQNMRQLNRQLITLDSDKKSMQSNISDAEKALRTAARDKEILAAYIKSVENALEQARREMSLSKEFNGKDVSLSKVLLDADFIPSDVGKAGPELIACQNLVGAFVDAQTQAFSKIKALEEEIESHRKHVNMLKRELSDAVHREYDAEMEAPTRDGLNRQGPDPNITSSSECFMPLREDTDVSFSLPKTGTPKAVAAQSKRGERSSPKFHTPGRSTRSHNIRPKAFEPHGR